ncbi:MAG: hypothetical protein HPY65_00805 [Syntrophaceae bacterium]|nr:hypothetical protein [Syntrophaceae bacterium]
MNKKVTRQVGRFKAVDASGKVYSIIIMQDFHISEEFGAEPQEIPGMLKLITAQGSRVNKIDENRYEILEGIEKIPVTRIV